MSKVPSLEIRKNKGRGRRKGVGTPSAWYRRWISRHILDYREKDVLDSHDFETYEELPAFSPYGKSRWVVIKEASEILGVGPNSFTIQRCAYKKRGQIGYFPIRKVGRLLYVDVNWYFGRRYFLDFAREEAWRFWLMLSSDDSVHSHHAKSLQEYAERVGFDGTNSFMGWYIFLRHGFFAGASGRPQLLSPPNRLFLYLEYCLSLGMTHKNVSWGGIKSGTWFRH